MERRRPSVRFVVTFVAGHDAADNLGAVRSLRAVLKNALRRHGLRAVDVKEIESAPENQAARAFGGLRRDVRDRLRGRSP